MPKKRKKILVSRLWCPRISSPITRVFIRGKKYHFRAWPKMAFSDLKITDKSAINIRYTPTSIRPEQKRPACMPRNLSACHVLSPRPRLSFPGNPMDRDRPWAQNCAGKMAGCAMRHFTNRLQDGFSFRPSQWCAKTCHCMGRPDRNAASSHSWGKQDIH